MGLAHQNQTLSIIGAGRVGQTLGRLWRGNNSFQISQVFCRSAEASSAAVSFIGGGEGVSDWSALKRADLFMIATPDDAIEEVCSKLLELEFCSEIMGVFHCSGAKDASNLKPLKDRGVFVAGMHPILSFASPKIAVDQFRGSYCALDGDTELVQLLRTALEQLGAQSIEIGSDMKPLYHVANVMISNFVTTLVQGSLELYEKLGIEQEQVIEIIKPLIRGSVENALKLGPKEALTGPVVRGDEATIERHLLSLQDNEPKFVDLYKAISHHTVSLAEARLDTSAEALARIRATLERD